jgi:Flp pilus assembly protein TadG
MKHGHRGQRGQALVVMALVGMTMFGFGAIALDQSVGMSDRRDLQAVVDSAALAGARSSSSGAGTENYIAMQYLAKSLNFNVSSVSGCTSTSNCPAGTYTVGNYTFTLNDNGNGSLDISAQHSRRTLLAGVLGFNTAVAGTAARAFPGGPTLTGTNYAVAVVGGDFLINGGGVKSNPTGNVAGPVYTAGSWYANNSQHPPGVTGTVAGIGGGGASQPGGVNDCSSPPTNNAVNHPAGAGGSDNWTVVGSGSATTNSNVTNPQNAFSGMAPTTTGPTFTTVVQASYTSGSTLHWKPGTYDGIFPTAGVADGGVFVIKNVAIPIVLGNITNAVGYTARGVEDPTGAVAIVLDSSDTGNLDLNDTQLDGLDDLQPLSYTGTRDPMGTHNFVVYGETFNGGLAPFGPQTTTNMSGIIYLPKASMTDHGRSSPQFAGSVYVASITIDGGGNGTQAFQWVCGLNAVSNAGGGHGLAR